jgi:hypothetical protein
MSDREIDFSRKNYCPSCDVAMEGIKNGYKIVSIKDMIKFEISGDDDTEKLIECVAVQLSKCPECGHSGLVDFGEVWLSKSEIRISKKKKELFSDSPEINIILRLFDTNI